MNKLLVLALVSVLSTSGFVIGKTYTSKTEKRTTAPAPAKEDPTVALKKRISELEDKLEQQHKSESEQRAALRRDYATWEFTEESGFYLSKICASEDSRFLRSPKDGGTDGELTEDCKLIAQTIYNNRNSKKSFKSWIDVMEFMSPHVTGKKTPVQARQHWLRNLRRFSGAMPEGWTPCTGTDERNRSTPKGCDGDWRLYGDNWNKGRDKIIEMWTTQSFLGITDIPLIAWGCSGKEGCNDDPIAEARGLCKTTLGRENSFWYNPNGAPCPGREEALAQAE